MFLCNLPRIPRFTHNSLIFPPFSHFFKLFFLCKMRKSGNQNRLKLKPKKKNIYHVPETQPQGQNATGGKVLNLSQINSENMTRERYVKIE